MSAWDRSEFRGGSWPSVDTNDKAEKVIEEWKSTNADDIDDWAGWARSGRRIELTEILKVLVYKKECEEEVKFSPLDILLPYINDAEVTELIGKLIAD